MQLRRLIPLALLAAGLFGPFLGVRATDAATSLAARLSGRILLDVERHGEAWYVWPRDLHRYSLGLPDEALRVMRSLGLGITDANLEKIPTENDSFSGDTVLRARLSGLILLQVEAHGEAWYVSPTDLKRYYLGRPAEALGVMRRFGLGITSANLAKIPASISSLLTGESVLIDDETVTTDRGSFVIDLVSLDRSAFRLITDTASLANCSDNCAAKSLAAYVQENGTSVGIHGTYFCPPDYASCAGMVNTFNPPVFNSAADLMINENKLPFHAGPMVTSDTSGLYRFFHRTIDFGYTVADFERRTGTTLSAALANYPSLMENGRRVVSSEPLEAKMLLQSTRGGFGFSESRVFLVIAKSASVIDLASIFDTIGATWAFNLDGGGSAALYAYGNYLSGPGRLLPNAMVFKKR